MLGCKGLMFKHLRIMHSVVIRWPMDNWLHSTLTTKRVKTRYNFRFFEGLETNRASNLFGEISQERLHCQCSTRSLVNTAWKSYCLKFREKQDVVEWPYELKLNIFRNWAIITQSRFCCRRSWPIRFLFVLFVCMFSRITDFEFSLTFLSRKLTCGAVPH